MLTDDLKKEATERGAAWGKQEAELLIEDIGNGNARGWHDWAMGSYAGALPYDAIPSEDRTEDQDAERDEYDLILDKAARAAFVAVGAEWQAAQQTADDAIDASLSSGEIERIKAWRLKPGTVSRLVLRCDGYSDDSPTQEREYWGTDGQGDTWRVHLPPVQAAPQC